MWEVVGGRERGEKWEGVGNVGFFFASSTKEGAGGGGRGWVGKLYLIEVLEFEGVRLLESLPFPFLLLR